MRSKSDDVDATGRMPLALHLHLQTAGAKRHKRIQVGDRGADSLDMLHVPTILVVDDEPILRNVTQRALERAGYKVMLANNGTAALALLQSTSSKVDLVLLDVVMPQQNGLEVSESISAKYPSTRFLFMSGFTASAMTGAVLKERGHPFLQKPFLPEDLVEAVSTALSGNPAAAAS